jgi:uncharacterized protein (UPF0332 family)
VSTQVDALVLYRLARARETIDEARVLAAAEHWSGCVNRLYYACYYAVMALMARGEESASKHTGVRAWFNMHVVHTGRVPTELGTFFNRLFDQRLRGDYRDFIEDDPDDVEAWLLDAQRFVEVVEKLARGEGPAE